MALGACLCCAPAEENDVSLLVPETAMPKPSFQASATRMLVASALRFLQFVLVGLPSLQSCFAFAVPLSFAHGLIESNPKGMREEGSRFRIHGGPQSQTSNQQVSFSPLHTLRVNDQGQSYEAFPRLKGDTRLFAACLLRPVVLQETTVLSRIFGPGFFRPQAECDPWRLELRACLQGLPI